MKFIFPLEQTADILTIRKAFWSGQISVYKNNDKVPLNSEGKYLILYPNNISKELIIKRKFWGLDPIPTVLFEGKEIDIARNLNAIEYIISCLPLFLLFRGAIGGFFGLTITWLNLLLQRSSSGYIVRWILVVFVSLLGLMGYVLITQFINFEFTLVQHHPLHNLM